MQGEKATILKALILKALILKALFLEPWELPSRRMHIVGTGNPHLGDVNYPAEMLQSLAIRAELSARPYHPSNLQ